MVQLQAIGGGKGDAPGFDLIAACKTLQQPTARAFIDAAKLVRLQPIRKLLVVAASLRLVGVRCAHCFGATDEQCFANKQPVVPALAGRKA